MIFHTNNIRDEFRSEHGFIDPSKFRPGESIDEANDCWLCHDGERIYIRNSTKVIDAQALGPLGAACDAIKEWERAANGERAFSFHYADDPSELSA